MATEDGRKTWVELVLSSFLKLDHCIHFSKGTFNETLLNLSQGAKISTVDGTQLNWKK